MENGYNRDKELITKKVEVKKYELNRNAPTVDAYTNEDYAVEFAPSASTSSDNRSYDSELNATTSTKDQNESNYGIPNEQYEAEFTPKQISSNYKTESATSATVSKQNKSTNLNEEYTAEVAPKIVDFNISGSEATTNNTASSNFSTSAFNASSETTKQNEEYAAEVAPNIIDFNRRDSDKETISRNASTSIANKREFSTSEANVDDVTSGRGIGGLALALSILSLFVLPIVLGAAGIIIGFIARRRGATKLGAWAIGIGAISIIVGMFILPFF